MNGVQPASYLEINPLVFRHLSENAGYGWIFSIPRVKSFFLNRAYGNLGEKANLLMEVDIFSERKIDAKGVLGRIVKTVMYEVMKGPDRVLYGAVLPANKMVDTIKLANEIGCDQGLLKFTQHYPHGQTPNSLGPFLHQTDSFRQRVSYILDRSLPKGEPLDFSLPGNDSISVHANLEDVVSNGVKMLGREELNKSRDQLVGEIIGALRSNERFDEATARKRLRKDGEILNEYLLVFGSKWFREADIIDEHE